MVLGVEVMRNLLIFLVAGVLSFVAYPQSIESSSKSALKVLIPVSDSVSGVLTLYEESGRCKGSLKLINQQPIGLNIDLPAPCDVMTRGSLRGFEPRVRYDTGDKPRSVRFRVLGALQYFPDYRSECSKIWLDVTLSWPGPKVGSTTAYVEEHKDILFCSRFYTENKWWSGMDW
jgi:hypothetical protein